MIPVELLSPFKQQKQLKYKQVFEAFQALRNKGAAAEIAKQKVSTEFNISKSGVEYILRQMQADGKSI